MSDSESTREEDPILGSWGRIWVGAALIGFAVFLLFASAGSAEDQAFWLFVSAASGLFGAVHFIVGCVMHALDLHERRAKISADQS